MRATTTALFVLAVAALTLGGCKDAGRPLSYNKGVYAGQPDTKLTSKQVDALRMRGNHQRD